ncbi:hypothetical protein CLV32_2380 [Pedobacter duraquae]|uniref:Uncharacterized protein n=1 Tax=Pedobacter duraquae TaxID=425511 RepID=A0A4R6IH67_9SPHI|nr:hypothetical protein CLV32_2380 [Pedobacter duraquae]
MKFLIAFYSTFIILSIVIVLIARSTEMLGFVIWFNLINTIVGAAGWILINQVIKSSSIYLMAIRLILGLLILNIMVFFKWKSTVTNLIRIRNKI